MCLVRTFFLLSFDQILVLSPVSLFHAYELFRSCNNPVERLN